MLVIQATQAGAAKVCEAHFPEAQNQSRDDLGKLLLWIQLSWHRTRSWSSYMKLC